MSRRPLPILAGLLLALLAVQVALGLCLQEDAFISFRYARNLVAGHGLVYNPGERVEGYTNFLWTVAIAAGMRAGLSPLVFARWLGVLCSLALVAVVWRQARGRDAARPGGPVTGGLVAAATVAFSLPVAAEGVQGLETVAFALLVAAGMLAGVRAREAGRGAGGLAGPTALLWLAALTRPEGVGVFGLSWLAALAWRRRTGRPRLPRAELLAVLLFVALYLPYWLWRFDYYGWPLPNTFYAKTGGGWSHAVRGLGYVGRFLLLHPVLALLTLATVAGAARRRAAARPAPPPALADVTAVTVVVGYLAYVVTVGGDFKETFRFVVPVLPLWAVALDAGVGGLATAWSERAPAGGARRAGRLLPALAIVALLLGAGAALPATLRWTQTRARDLARRTACGLWLRDNATPDAVLAIHSAGIIPYWSGLRTIDMWGINDAHIAHRKLPDLGRGRRIGHEKHDAPYVFARDPDYHVDEVYYVTAEPVPDLARRVFVAPGSWPVAARYAARSVPVVVDEGNGLQRRWFNFLERRRDGGPANPPAPTPR